MLLMATISTKTSEVWFMTKVHSLTKQRQRRKPRSPEEAAKAASRIFPDTPKIKEPKAFASGSMNDLSQEDEDYDEKK